MPSRKHKGLFGAAKVQSKLLVLFIPSVDRHHQPIDQDFWVTAALKQLGETFGGATAFPKARGVWRDDRQAGLLIYDEPVVIHCYTSLKSIENGAEDLRNFLVRMGTATNQGAVGFVIAGDYFEISFPMED